MLEDPRDALDFTMGTVEWLAVLGFLLMTWLTSRSMRRRKH